MASRKHNDLQPNESLLPSVDTSDGEAAAHPAQGAPDSPPTPSRIVVAGDGYADELDDTGEFLPLAATLIGATAGTASSDNAEPVAAPVATPNERATFWLKHLESEIERLQYRWEAIAAELSAREERIEELVGETHSRQASIDQLRADISARVAAAADLQAERDAAEARIAELLDAQKERAAALATRDGELAATRESLATQQAELAAAAATQTELLATLEQSRLETAAAANRHQGELAASDELRVKVQELEAYIDGRSSSWAAQNAKLAEYRNELTETKATAATTESRLATQIAQCQALAAKLAAVERDAAALAALQQNSASENAALEKRLADEAATVATVRADLAAAHKNAEEVAAEVAQREDLLASLERGVERRDQTIGELEQSLQRSRAVEKQLGADNRALTEQTADFAQGMAHRDEQIGALQAAAADAERSALKTDERNVKLERLLRESAAEVSELQEALAVRDHLIGQLKRDLLAKQDALDLLELNVHRLNDLGARLEGMDSASSSPEIVSATLHPVPIGAALPTFHSKIEDVGEPLEDASAPPHTGKMIIAIDGAEARRYRLRANGMMIGRSLKSDIRIASPFISRFHARISLHNEQPVIEDLGSKNGILINSKPAGRAAPLHDGDIINLGGQLELKYVDLDRRHGVDAPS